MSPPGSPKRQRLAGPENDSVNVGAGTSQQRPEAVEGSRSSEEESLDQNLSDSTSSSGVSSIVSFAPDPKEVVEEECAVDADVLATFRQQKVTKCILENAVNRIVESYQFLVHPEDLQPSPHENDGLEDAAILMAIREHGLSASGVAETSKTIPVPHANPTTVAEKEHLDFMEAAVAVAIQKKGLTPLSLPLSPHR